MASDSRRSLIALVLLFGLLWLPFGQESFLYEHWMDVGVFGAAFLLTGALLFVPSPWVARRDFRFLTILLFAAYAVHQFEEHGVDILGRSYAFVPFFNELIGSRIAGCAGRPDCPLDPENTFYVNTTLVWFVILLGAWGVRRLPFTGLCAAGILATNGLVHIAQGIALGGYNPGLLTSVVLFVPLSVLYYALALREGIADRTMVAASLLWGALGHVVLIGGLILVYVQGRLPHSAYFVILVAYSVTPFLLFRRAKQ